VGRVFRHRLPTSEELAQDELANSMLFLWIKVLNTSRCSAGRLSEEQRGGHKGF